MIVRTPSVRPFLQSLGEGEGNHRATAAILLTCARNRFLAQIRRIAASGDVDEVKKARSHRSRIRTGKQQVRKKKGWPPFYDCFLRMQNRSSGMKGS